MYNLASTAFLIFQFNIKFIKRQRRVKNVTHWYLYTGQMTHPKFRVAAKWHKNEAIFPVSFSSLCVKKREYTMVCKCHSSCKIARTCIQTEKYVVKLYRVNLIWCWTRSEIWRCCMHTGMHGRLRWNSKELAMASSSALPTHFSIKQFLHHPSHHRPHATLVDHGGLCCQRLGWQEGNQEIKSWTDALKSWSSFDITWTARLYAEHQTHSQTTQKLPVLFCQVKKKLPYADCLQHKQKLSENPSPSLFNFRIAGIQQFLLSYWIACKYCEQHLVL